MIFSWSISFKNTNPTASGAWSKYFTPYTHSVVRRIDESILARFERKERNEL